MAPHEQNEIVPIKLIAPKQEEPSRQEIQTKPKLASKVKYCDKELTIYNGIDKYILYLGRKMSRRSASENLKNTHAFIMRGL